MAKLIVCRFCGSEFAPAPDKPGRINVCTDQDCQKRDRRQAPEPEKLMAEVSWENKHTPVITVTTADKATWFNKVQMRHGAAPLSSFGWNGFPPKTDERDGSVIGSTYRTNLGETRRIA